MPDPRPVPDLVGRPRGAVALDGAIVPETDFERAILLALPLHGDDVRKSGSIPYIAHLLAVAGIVLEQQGSPAQVVAALLHDAAEDHGGEPTIDAIRSDFGDDVARIVEACSDALPQEGVRKEAWLPRKRRYLAHLEEADPDVLLVSLADKIHNSRAILGDVREHGLRIFERFSAPEPKRDWTLEYYVALTDIFLDRLGTPAARELERIVTELCAESGYTPRHSLSGQ